MFFFFFFLVTAEDGLNHELLTCKENKGIFHFDFNLSEKYGIMVQSEEEKKKLVKFDVNLELEVKRKNSLCCIIGNMYHYV